jgi:hypothetical protein
MDPGIMTAIRGVVHAVQTGLGTVEAVYSRDAASCPVSLTLTQSSAWLVNPMDNVSTRVNQIQFLAWPEDIDLGDGPIEPAPGDLVSLELAGWAYQFEVRAPQAGEPCFAWVDPMCVCLRFHAKMIARTAVASSGSSDSSESSPSS